MDALRSLVAQTWTAWEAIVIDNLSDDDTVEVVDRINDDRIRLVRFSNHGIIGASRNEGIRHATADLVCFLDSDDTWSQTKLEKVITIFAQRPDVDLVCHDEWLTLASGEGRVVRHGPYTTYEDLLLRGNSLSASAVAVRRTALSRVGGFSEDTAFVGSEDYELWLRLARSGARIAYLHEVLGTYRVHLQSFTNTNEVYHRNHLNVLEFHFDCMSHKTFWTKYRMRRRRCAILRSAAQTYLKKGEYRKAWRFAHRALGEDPFSWKAWVLGVMSVFRLRMPWL